MSYTLVFVRSGLKKRSGKITPHIHEILAEANLNKSWRYEILNPEEDPACNTGSYTYERQVEFIFGKLEDDDFVELDEDEASDEEVKTCHRQWAKIVRVVRKLCGAQKYNTKESKLVIEDNDDTALAEDFAAANGHNDVECVDAYLTQNFEINIDRSYPAFSRLYNREPHCDRIISALEIARDTAFTKRFHCVLYGPPGAAKTTLVDAIAGMLGQEGLHYKRYDATGLSKAGAYKDLFGERTPPPILLVEEIEKVNPTHFTWMLGLLDERARIQKNDARFQGHKNLRMLCIATVNDIDLFRKAMSGALASRFSNKIYCDRPSRSTLENILAREVREIDGNPAWIEPTLRYCVDQHPDEFNYDPRAIVTVMLCGRDKLLNDEYQAQLEATKPPSPEYAI